MHFIQKIIAKLITACVVAIYLSGAVFASDSIKKVAIQVSSNDPAIQTLALNNVSNLLTHFGIDNIEIELVAYGPGLSILTTKSPNSERVSSMALQNVTFSACGNTMKKMTKKTGVEPVLTEGVQVVPAGVVQLMKLQEEGYSYIKP